MKHFSDLFSQMCRAMTELGEDARIDPLPPSMWQPPVDIYERGDAILIVMEIPGVNKDQIEVTLKGGVLKISGFRSKRTPEATTHVHRIEVPSGRFVRYIRLPACADVAGIEASHEDGFLTITIPKGANG